MHMQQWEYWCETSPSRKREALSDDADAAMLRRLGDAGWELTSVVAIPETPSVTPYIPRTYRVWYYFKRPKTIT